MRGNSVTARPRGSLAAAASACLFLTLGACANSYAGIPLKPGAAPADLQDLARRARTGDKRAQLELGVRYEEGRGVAKDLQRAKKLYCSAGQNSGGPIWVYSPPVGNEKQGRVFSVDSGSAQPGLPEAARRLETLSNKEC